MNKINLYKYSFLAIEIAVFWWLINPWAAILGGILCYYELFSD